MKLIRTTEVTSIPHGVKNDPAWRHVVTMAFKHPT